MPYEFIDHTGDVGIAVRAPTVESLFAEAASAMFAILADAPQPHPAGRDLFPLSANPTADDLRDFLADLLGRFAVEHRMYVGFAPVAGCVEASWERFDLQRHALRTEIKAVTYHQLRLERDGTGWLAQVIFDV